MTDSEIFEFVKEYFKVGGIQDDGSSSEYYGTPDDFLKFASLMYNKGHLDGVYEQSKRYMEKIFDD